MIATEPKVPPDLAAALRRGDCVAFVGAGFSAAVVPGWGELLRDLSSEAPGPQASQARELLSVDRPTAFDLEAAAQILRSAMGDDSFARSLRKRLAHPQRDTVVEQRLAWLRGIPFRAILTTNFDGLLEGPTPGPEAYLSVLRPGGHRWWDRRFWEEGRPGPRVVKLHGDVATDPPTDLVLSRRDYRQRLYGSAAYATFLRAVLATTTVVYLGFSFTDAYLNELRSEVLALLDYRGADRPVAYAVVNDVPEGTIEYFAEHEGIVILPYSTGPDQNDFSGFDRWLEAIHDSTNPVGLLGRVLSGKRLLWLDAEPRNNDFGMGFLMEAASSHGGPPCEIVNTFDWESALRTLADGHFDLVITHWGHDLATDPDGAAAPVAERFLREVRLRDLRVPTIVFATGDYADENKRRALGLGAAAYVFDWPPLFRQIQRVLQPGELGE